MRSIGLELCFGGAKYVFAPEGSFVYLEVEGVLDTAVIQRIREAISVAGYVEARGVDIVRDDSYRKYPFVSL